jgi:hypothetical protein
VHVNVIAPLSRAYTKITRQIWSSSPTSITPESIKAWESRLFRYFSTPQPYTSPLTMAGGNLTGETWQLRESYREFGLKEPAAKWVHDAIACSAEGWPGLLFNMLFPSLTDGHSLIEPVWGHMDPHDKRYPGWWTVKAFPSIDTNYTRFRLDTFRQVVAVQSIAGNQGAVQLDPKDFLIFTHFKLFENPFGISDMRAAVRGCQILDSAIRLRTILLNNNSGPYLVATAKDNGARAKLMQLMNKARANGWIVIPEGSEVKVMDLATSAPERFQAAIDDCRKDIIRAITGSYLQLMEGSTSDATGNTQVHKGIAELYVWWLATWVSQVINHQLIPLLVEPQFGRSVGMPRLSLGGIDEATVSAALDRFRKGLEIGLDNISKHQAMTVGGFESAEDESDRLKLPQQGAAQTGQGNAGGQDANDPFAGIFADSVHVHKVNAKGGPDSSGGTFPVRGLAPVHES